MVNFAECQSRWLPLNETLNATEYSLYTYTGHVRGIASNRHTQLNLDGCLHLCGAGADPYPWSQWSNTLTTWIFPIVGIILQAPFESNEVLRTFFTLARWIGNPIASLTYILWNIKVTGRSATIVDMAWPTVKTISEDLNNKFQSIRDSFFLLNVMNQYTMQHRKTLEAEGLLRIALFSKDIRLLRKDVDPIELDADGWYRTVFVTQSQPEELCTCLPRLEKEGHLDAERRRLALHLRKFRRRGVVPVYISTVWFIIALAFSINAAFGLQRRQTESHDLALGLLLSWLPVLILSSVVDRNPIAAEEIRDELNHLIDRVRRSLMDFEVRERYIKSIHSETEQDEMEARVVQINAACRGLDNFFGAFAGQGRKRWHYGCCHPIVRDIEKTYLNRAGRNWLLREDEARTQFVLGRPDETALYRYDPRETWQILSSLIIVWGTAMGAFVLSYCVPTVGLGCRSGGYMIFLIITTFIFCVEMTTWPFIHKGRLDLRGQRDIHYILILMEIISTGWLTYIIFAQISGSYQTCKCLTSAWSGQNYIDLTQWATTDSTLTELSWIASTVVSVPVMGLAMLYIVSQWLFQSHLNTVDPQKAAQFRQVRLAILQMLPQSMLGPSRLRSESDARERPLPRTGTDAMEAGRPNAASAWLPPIRFSYFEADTTLSIVQPMPSPTTATRDSSSSNGTKDITRVQVHGLSPAAGTPSSTNSPGPSLSRDHDLEIDNRK